MMSWSHIPSQAICYEQHWLCFLDVRWRWCARFHVILILIVIFKLLPLPALLPPTRMFNMFIVESFKLVTSIRSRKIAHLIATNQVKENPSLKTLLCHSDAFCILHREFHIKSQIVILWLTHCLSYQCHYHPVTSLSCAVLHRCTSE